jgi:hypothetical protein
MNAGSLVASGLHAESLIASGFCAPCLVDTGRIIRSLAALLNDIQDHGFPLTFLKDC